MRTQMAAALARLPWLTGDRRWCEAREALQPLEAGSKQQDARCSAIVGVYRSVASP